MEQLYARCARLSLLREGRASRTIACQSVRRFSASMRHRDESSDVSRGAGSLPKRTGRHVDLSAPGPNRAPAPRRLPPRPMVQQSRPTYPTQQSPRPEGQLLIRRMPFESPNSRQPTPSGGRVLSRTPGRGSAVPPSVVISRQINAQRNARRQEQGSGQRRRPNNRGGPPINARRRRRGTQPEDMAVDMSTDEADAFLNKPHTATEPLPYTPKDRTIEDLRTDWPDTAISPIGAVESIQQRMEYLARRIPHGYETPEDLALHYQKGNLTRFETNEERDKVLALAKELAEKRALKLTERQSATGVVAADDMSFADLASSAEKTSLAVKMVQGIYPELEKQRMPFLDHIVKALRNNETYHEAEAEQFVRKIESFLRKPAAAG